MIPYFSDDAVISQNAINQLISESFLTVKGAALFLPRGNGSSTPRISHRRNKHAGDLQQHLQAMFVLLRPEDNIRLAVRLESSCQNRTRYMVVVSTNGRQDTEESIVLGMDFSSNDSSICTMGLVLPLWSDALIHLDGDGGFSVSTDNRIHIFKPVSVQAMWSALQSLHKACEVARIHNYYPSSLFLTWVSYYESHINSDQASVNEWNAMQDVQSHRPDSPALFTDVPTERERTERLIKTKLREIMMQKDLENITSKEIRTELEVQMACSLREFKEFIDNKMIVILGQMDSPTQIFDHVFLGSEWNASNLEDLQNRGVRYILNVTREIDNFFPGTFEYHNIRVYDEEATDLLAYWNDTYKFISKAKKNGSKCLVHCKMGVSRSASTVIAYAMKEYGWTLDRAYDYVKQRRSVAKPNPSFMRQLEEYQGILLASKQRHNKLWRSHSDSDLSDHHEPLGQSGMEVSRKEITTSADRISENKPSLGHHPPVSPGPPAGGPPEPLCRPGPDPDPCARGRASPADGAPQGLCPEQEEDRLNLNSLDGCCPAGAACRLDNRPPVGALLHRPAAGGFPELAVQDVEDDALRPGDSGVGVRLLPLEELQPAPRGAPGRRSPSPPPPGEAEPGTDRIDFFSALGKFVELSQEGGSRGCAHARSESQGGGRNGPPKGPPLELSPAEPPEEGPPSTSASSSPQASEGSSPEEEQLKVSELTHSSGLTRSHSENALSVKEIVTEIESIHQGGGPGQAKMDGLGNSVPTPKRTALHDLSGEATPTRENKSGKAEQGEGAGPAPEEAAQEAGSDPEGAWAAPAPPCKPAVEEATDLGEDPAEGCRNPGPKWCPGSVRRATLEFEERLRQEHELQYAVPAAALPLRKSPRNEAEPPAKGRAKEAPREPPGGWEAEPGPRPPPASPPASPLSLPLAGPEEEEATEHRTVVSLDSQERVSAPCRLLLPRRIEIIEYTPVARLPGAVERAGRPAAGLRVDENCNAPLCPESPEGTLAPDGGSSERAAFSLGSPEEEEEEEEEAAAEAAGAVAHPAISPPAGRPWCGALLHPDRLRLVCLEGVTRDATCTDPEPPPRAGSAGHRQLALDLRRKSEGALPAWSPGALDGPAERGLGRPPLRRGLLQRSGSDSLREVRRGGGLVKQRAEELEARIRQAGLTTPSLMKRSASLAKLDRLDLSKDDLARPAHGPVPGPHEPGWGCPAAPGPALPAPASRGAPRPTAHLVEPLRLTECLALSRPVERPPAQYAKELNPGRPLAGAKLTNSHAGGPLGLALPGPAQRPAVLPRHQHARTRPPRRLKKATDRRRSSNPLYNTM
ncbi:protein phosphatase Slingshot homolog 2 isoform X1 [Varanus komodoensis]|uniref:protein phosphatase Slingshot homolog 2 isoform X1 n=2 Tax=Varanus komodoensis TaxID=61221 RepID=UPI001CF7759B|nr:protein phosphatase Slingshot homolog 2 isoform X1 [Varanus komodoensis]